MPPQLSREFAIAVALLAALGAPSPAVAEDGHAAQALPADHDEPVSVHVELVVDTLPKSTRAAVERELDGQLTAAVDELDLVIAESDSAELILRVEIGQPNHKAPVYVVNSLALANGQVFQRGDARTCLRCTPEELVIEGLAILASATTRALAARPKPVEDPTPAPVLVDDGEPLGPRAIPPGPSTYIGMSLGALGLVGAAAGGALLINEDEIRSNRVAGFTLLSAGLTSLVSGLTLVVVDVWVLAPHRRDSARIELSLAGLHF